MQRKIITKVKKAYVENGIMEYDNNLKIICDEIIDNIPIESIILCGSRATRQGVTETSDYDIPVVMKTYLVPFYLSKLKKIEKVLSQKLHISVSINPLPTFRIKNAKGNLFLFKVKREGITLYGNDYIRELDPGDIKDISIDRHFSLLFSAAKELIRNFDIRFLKEYPNQEENKKIIRDTAKAMIYCAEVRLLMNNHYETTVDNMISRLSILMPDEFVNDLNAAIDIRYKNEESVPDQFEFWFKVRDHILETFIMLVSGSMNKDTIDMTSLVGKYLRNKDNDYIKNFQYFSLVILNRKKFLWRSLTINGSIEDRIRIALLFLLVSIEKNDYIDSRIIKASYKFLQTITDIKYSTDKSVLWENVKYTINDYWSFGCTVIGV